MRLFGKRNKADVIGSHVGHGVIVDGVAFTFDYLDIPGRDQQLVGAYAYRLDLLYEFHPNNDYKFVVQFLHDEIRRLKE